MQVKLYIILFTLFFFSLNGAFVTAQTDDITKENIKLADQDSIESNKSTKNNAALLIEPTDSILTDSIKRPKGAIDDIISHKAVGYIRENFIKTLITLHDQAEIDYGDLNIKAGHIVINHETNMVMATGIIDTTGYVQKPIVVQGAQESTHDSIRLNYK